MPANKRPSFFYGWVVVAVTVATLAIVYGSRFSFAIFFVAILKDFGWSRATTAGIYSTNIVVYGVCAPLAGFLSDRWGPKKVIPTGVLIVAIGLAASSLANAPWHFYLTYGVIAIGMALGGYVPHASIISNWFIQKRGQAMGIALAGNGASFIIGSLAQILISSLGWRGAYLILVFLCVAVILPIMIFLKNKPEEMALYPDGIPAPKSVTVTDPINPIEHEMTSSKNWGAEEWTLAKALKTYRFWLLFFASLAMLGISFQLVITHFPALLVGVGYSQNFAAFIYGLFGVIIVGGRLAGFIGDVIGREWTFTLGGIGFLLALAILFTVNDTSFVWILYFFALLLGLAFGMAPPTQASIAADFFQGKSFGTINGLIVAGFGLGGTLGPLLGGYIFDATGSYRLALILVALNICLAVALIWLAAPRKVKRMVRQI
ncbi:MAG: MFS transporter [Chloroflexi bacterium]|nr:MFS transporter [Chloroflexota bacterium]